MPAVPIHVVREDGRVERLGEWRSEGRVLALEREGFPLLGPGEHSVAGDLPWVFWEMCPSGYLGRAFARRYPELALGSNPAEWGAAECLRAISAHGSDLPGNLIVGAQSLSEYEARRADAKLDAQEQNLLLAHQYEAVREGGSSSIGGDRPKFAVGNVIIKYSPPISTELGRRWCDLLLSEHHCASVLSAAGVPAVETVRDASPINERLYLPIIRYDRIARGRVGATTLYFYTAEHIGDVSLQAPSVVRRILDESAYRTCSLIHDFSAAIGNTDAHLGNYGLIFDPRGKAALAPAFDVLPMALAPRHDELPDASLGPRTVPISENVRPLVEDLARRIDADAQISPEFKQLWRRYVGL